MRIIAQPIARACVVVFGCWMDCDKTDSRIQNPTGATTSFSAVDMWMEEVDHLAEVEDLD